MSQLYFSGASGGPFAKPRIHIGKQRKPTDESGAH